ncbi:hypothetical protein [Stenotrophomonas chelatiphaga]|uniref:hypothetical protein n=1 Tax=Stenotrophomonas chelatiphaga TaxID=517011 RepID=UPI00289EEFA4|nr:hypothetical protein [Stenotrophomonas chelatiphaga]
MQILSQLGLMFRATVLNQLAAKVRLASSHYSPSRFSAALTGIDNREQQLANRFSQGRLSVDQLYHQARRLADQDVLLNTRLDPESDCDGAVARQPVATASAFRSVLVRAYCAAADAKKQELVALLEPAMVRTRARCMLADAAWKGHITCSTELLAQVHRQAHLEAVDAACPLDQMDQVERRAARDILSFIASQQPDGPDEALQPVRTLLQDLYTRLPLATSAPAPDPALQIPPSWLRLANGVWGDLWPWPTYEHFRAEVAAAVEDVMDLNVRGLAQGDQRCQRTFELLEYIRQRVPTTSGPFDHPSRPLWEHQSDRLEREVAAELVARRAEGVALHRNDSSDA